jgi:hypothetical protein
LWRLPDSRQQFVVRGLLLAALLAAIAMRLTGAFPHLP